MRRYVVGNLSYVSIEAAIVYLIVTNHPFLAGIAMFIKILVAAGLEDIRYEYYDTSMPYAIYTSLFFSGLAATIYLLMQAHPYWAGANLFLLFIGVSLGLYSMINRGTRIHFLPGGTVFAIGGLAASVYLITQNHPFWAGAVILITLFCSMIKFTSHGSIA